MSAENGGRLSSGVRGLDRVLGGGFAVGGIHLLAGGSGTGKTVIANQFCFAHAGARAECMYVTVLAESHSRMIANLESFEFFDAKLLAERIAYISGARTIREGGLEALFSLIEHEVRRREPAVLVLDGLTVGARMAGESEADVNAFLNRLSALLEYCRCTALICVLCELGLTPPAYALADGLIEISYERVDRRAARELFVRKLRGAKMLDGVHRFEITAAGARVYPRAEVVSAEPGLDEPPLEGRAPFGIERLDEMLGGGLPLGTTTAVIGEPGAGKTLLGLHFLARAAAAGERALYFGFFEGPAQLTQQAERVGLPVDRLRREGVLEIVRQQPFDNIADALAERLLQRLGPGAVRYLFIDGADVLGRSVLYRDTVPEFLAALAHALRERGVTALLSFERTALGTDPVPGGDWSAVVDNSIILRHGASGPRLRQLVRITKVRASAFDPTLRELIITSGGMQVGEPFNDGTSGSPAIGHPGRETSSG